MTRKARDLALANIPVLLLLGVFIFFTAIEPSFFNTGTLINVARQASYVGILAVGLTLVLMTAGIDLSVGALMYLSVVVVAEAMQRASVPLWSVPLMAVAVGLALGAVNGFVVGYLRVIPFIVTLATLTLFRGYGLSLSDSREVNYPRAISLLGRQTVLGVPLPIVIFVLVVIAGHILVTRTPFGRQMLATGEDPKAAARAGVSVRRVHLIVFTVSGGLAGLAGVVALMQLGTASPAFGTGDEFDAIAAAVLGGTSLFGGRGSVFPGTVAGALLLQLINAGLVFARVDLYLTPMVGAAIILAAVLVDSLRTRRLATLERRTITSSRATAVVT